MIRLVQSHGCLSSPVIRGAEKKNVNIDSIRNPNSAGLCRGEPKGKVTNVSPGPLTLQFEISAPHIGPCEVYLLDANLGNSKKIASKMNCASPPGPWTVDIPSDVSGHHVLRWTWDAQHISKSDPEKYENCSDLNISGNGGGKGKKEEDFETPNKKNKENSKYTSPATEENLPKQDNEKKNNKKDLGEIPAETSGETSIETPGETPIETTKEASDSNETYENNLESKKKGKNSNFSRPSPLSIPKDQTKPEKPSGNGNDETCIVGKMKCSGNGYLQCVPGGKFQPMPCPGSLKCKPNDDSIVCS